MAHVTDDWVASGGEDGTVRLSHLVDNRWTTPVVAHSHLSSVRAVAVTRFAHQTLLFSAGGRAQLKMWRVNLNCPKSASLEERSSVMLRAEKQGRHWLSALPIPDPETRYMDLHTVQSNPSTLLVLAACSDAYLRIFSLDSSTGELCLYKSEKSGQCCLLRVTSFRCDVTVIVTTATDGSVTLWELDSVTVFASELVHKSGVNSVSVSTQGIEEGRVLLATGGDDNTLSLRCYHIHNPLSANTITSWACSTLHSSAITGVELLDGQVLCCGADQRVSLLSWHITGDHLSVNLVAQYCCSVPDIKGLSILHARQYDKFTFCVYGVGMEVLESKQEKRISAPHAL
uniref:tRNA (34-2'-O)-methyltransferase regulator WDR6 n=2 Tax=Graphocephala atropunctata TaxID=36148 RepID=A0A1B6MKJ7_9HEMI